jgi:Tfp pilus assembly protein PilX
MNETTPRWRDRRGVALPLALVGLVAVSLLVTTALLTSSTETAISAAQASSARLLYDAEAGLQEYLRQAIVDEEGLTAGAETVTLRQGEHNEQAVRLTTALLRNTNNAAGNGGSRTVSILAEPLAGANPTGRAILAMVTQEYEFNTMALNVNEGAVVGSDLEVGGNSKVIDNSTICSDTVGAGAVKHADGTDVGTKGSGKIEGEVRESNNAGQAFIDEILGSGKSLDDFAELAEIQFGPMFDEDPFPNSAKAKWDADDVKLRWGCPLQMGISCPNAASTQFYPIIAIDAQGGTVDLQGDHGQGILIVVNGSLAISGNFLFKGIILIEGYIDMTGTGGKTGSKIEGSVIAFGQNTDVKSRVDESQSSGNAVIAYNRCEVKAAQEAFNNRARNNPLYSAPSTTFAWFEVVR